MNLQGTTLAKESIFLAKLLARIQQRLRRRSRFTNQTHLLEELSDLRMITRTDRRIRAARISDVDTEMLHRRFHHRR